MSVTKNRIMEDSLVKIARYFFSRWTKMVSLLFAFLTLSGVTVAYSYEAHLGDRLVKGHSIEDYVSLALSHTSLFNTFVVSGILGLLFLLIIALNSIYNKSIKGTKLDKLLKFDENSLFYLLLLVQAFLISFVYLIHVGNERDIRLTENGYRRVLTVEVKNDTEIKCVSLLREIAGFTYFYSLDKEAVVSIKTENIDRVTENRLISRDLTALAGSDDPQPLATRITLSTMRENLIAVKNRCQS